MIQVKERPMLGAQVGTAIGKRYGGERGNTEYRSCNRCGRSRHVRERSTVAYVCADCRWSDPDYVKMIAGSD